MSLGCTACKSGDSVAVLRKDELSLRRCRECGTVFLADYADAFVAELYDYYRRHVAKAKEEVFDPITGKRCLELLARFAGLLRGRRLLDVGCGLGQFVDLANRNGWQDLGFELAGPAVEFARRHGIAVCEDDFLTAELPENSYDLVTFFELLEHVPEPAAFLRRAAEVVRPGGLAYLTTPNFDSLERRILGPDWSVIHREHLSYFTPRTLSAMVLQVGDWEIVDLETRNISVAALNAWQANFFRRGGAKTADGSGGGGGDAADLRRRMEESPALGLVKRVANTFLRGTGTGAGISMLLRRTGTSVTVS